MREVEVYLCPVNWEAVEAVGVWVGAAVALLALRAAWKTVKDVASQAAAASTQADAASAQAAAAVKQLEVVLNSDRAWLDGELLVINNVVARYRLQVTNHGRTPARLVRYTVRYGFVQHGIPIFPDRVSDSYSETLQMWVGSGKTEPLDYDLKVDHSFDTSLSTAEIPDVVIYIEFVYANIITGAERHTSFKYLYNPLTTKLARVPEENVFE